MYEHAAQGLGQFNGAYLTGRPLPTSSHVSHRWLRAFVETFAPAFAQLPELRDQSLVRRCWPGALLDRVLELWAERTVLLDALETLPQTFCHLDAHPRNLLLDATSQEIVAVDWSYAGIAAIGSELASVVAASACFYDAEPDQLTQTDLVSFDAYVAGLRAAGWHGDRRAVRLGFTTAVALHYGLFPMGFFLLDDGLLFRFEKLFGHGATDIAHRWAAIAAYLLDRADEARRLVEECDGT
jgi:hypothetical protein